MFMAVLRNMGHAVGIFITNGFMGHILAIYKNTSLAHAAQPGNSLHQFRLAVAVDSGNADNLTFANLETYMVHYILRMSFTHGFHAYIFYFQYHFLRTGLGFFHCQVHLPSNHHLRHGFLVRVGHFNRTDISAAPQYRTTIRHRFNLIQFMGYEQNGFSFRYQFFHNPHQFVYFLWRQNSRRFIKYQYIIIPVQHFQDFHPLLHTYGNIGNQGIRIHQQIILFTQRHDLLPGLCHPDHAAFHRLHTQNNILQHSKIMYQLKMLVHHTNSQRIGI